MGQISGQASQHRVPSPKNGININRCATPTCPNFDVPATASRHDPSYKISGTGKNSSALKCLGCGRNYTIKSNQAIADELTRFEAKPQLSNVYRQDGYSCHNVNCDNFGLYTDTPSDLYRKRGQTSSGNPRIQCRSCGITFTRGSQKRRSHPSARTHDNVWLFKLLVNQTSINRAMELTELSPRAIYKKIDMFYERCLFFAQQREKRLSQMDLRWMRLATDRQEYQVNWTHRKDKRNVILSAIGSADKSSRYVFGMNVNFDESINLAEVAESDAYKADEALKDYNRTYARIWTPRDYWKAVKSSNEFRKRAETALSGYLTGNALPLSEAGLEYIRAQVEEEFGMLPSEITSTTRLPGIGTLVRSEYTMYAHFRRLNELLGHTAGLRFYLDQEPAINRACCLAFAKQIREGSCHVAYVKIDKELTVDERLIRVNITDKMVNEILNEGLAQDVYGAHRVIAESSLNTPYYFPRTKEAWFYVPVHRIYEAEKYVSVLTDSGKLGHDQMVSMLVDASLHPIDNFFQIVRRRISALERPIHSSSNAGRVWTGKSPYNPDMVHKLLQMLRIYFNYCLKGDDDRQNPAQRLGLAKGPVEIRKILYPAYSSTSE